MPSDESERARHDSAKATSSNAPAAGGPGGPPPAEFVAWGPVRDAVAALHNLEMLLKSPRVSAKTLTSVLPELLASCGKLRDAFTLRSGERSREAQAARATLCEFTLGRIDELETAMRGAVGAELETRTRLSLEQVVTRVSVDLDAAAELLDLAERAENAAPTELSVRGLARVSRVAAGGNADREVTMRFDDRSHQCVLSADPHVLTRLIAFAAARARAHGGGDVALRVDCDEKHARIVVEPMAEGDALLPPFPTRLARRIDATDAVVEAAANAAGIVVEVSAAKVTYRVPRVE
jgi:hypothetical protein